jgi:hypothetical protein
MGAGAGFASGARSTAETTSRLPEVGASVSADDVEEAASRSRLRSADGLAGALHAAMAVTAASVNPESHTERRVFTASSTGSFIKRIYSTPGWPYRAIKYSELSSERSFEKFTLSGLDESSGVRPFCATGG